MTRRSGALILVAAAVGWGGVFADLQIRPRLAALAGR